MGGGMSYNRATFTAIATATDEIVAAQAGKSIQVHAMVVTCDGNATVTFKSGTTSISGDLNLGLANSFSLSFSPVPYLTTAPGEALQVTAATNGVDGWLVYSVVG